MKISSDVGSSGLPKEIAKNIILIVPYQSQAKLGLHRKVPSSKGSVDAKVKAQFALLAVTPLHLV